MSDKTKELLPVSNTIIDALERFGINGDFPETWGPRITAALRRDKAHLASLDGEQGQQFRGLIRKGREFVDGPQPGLPELPPKWPAGSAAAIEHDWEDGLNSFYRYTATAGQRAMREANALRHHIMDVLYPTLTAALAKENEQRERADGWEECAECDGSGYLKEEGFDYECNPHLNPPGCRKCRPCKGCGPAHQNDGTCCCTHCNATGIEPKED